jgi:hypothetical protein
VRLGVSRLADLLGTSRPLKQPITVMLSARRQAAASTQQVPLIVHSPSSAAGSAPWQQQQLLPGSMTVIQHDFRANSMCVVGLQLSPRNCAAQGAEVLVEVREMIGVYNWVLT